MINTENEIGDLLKGSVVIIGVGNPMRSDDGLGPALIVELKNAAPRENPQAYLIDAGEAPENYLIPIINRKPDSILIIDAADLNAEPGEMRVIESSEVRNLGLSTHNASLKMFMEILQKETRATIRVIGVQPEKTRLGFGLSDEIKNAVEKLSKIICKGLNHA